MTVSRRLRFEVLRRDGYTCRYCGAKAPDVTLTVDHVVPTTLGGDDDPRNLVACCQQCNAGKSSIAPDDPIVEDVDATAMLFADAIERVASARRADRDALNGEIARFDEHWQQFHNAYYDTPPRDADWRSSIERFISLGLNVDDLIHFTHVTMRGPARGQNVWRYFCGCCWRELTTRQELARQAIEDGDV
jgi:hypothetical protein